MINIEKYRASIEAFSQMDLASSWVFFSKKQIRIGEVIHDIYLPQVEQKPHKIIRLIKRIFELFFGGSNYLTIAKSLNRFTQDIARVLPDDRVGLMARAQQNSIRILERFREARQGSANEFNQFDTSIRWMLTEALGEQNRLQDINDRAVNAEARNRDLRARNLGLEARNRDLEARNRDPKACAITLICNGKRVTLSPSDLVYSMDWDGDNPFYFSMDYFANLVNSIEKHLNQEADLPPDLKSKFIKKKDRSKFMKFLISLMHGSQIFDHYQNELTKENTDRIRQMTLAILNTLNRKRSEVGFQELYAIVVSQFCEALNHCSNGINTNIESIYTKLAYPKDGDIGFQTKLALQQLRDNIFRGAILECIQTSARPDFYLKHEASTVTYYFSKLSGAIFLPPSVSSMDRRWEAYSLKGQEEKILRLFHERYTPEKILSVIQEKICNTMDPEIPTRLFTDWVLKRLRAKILNDHIGNLSDERLNELVAQQRHNLLEENGEYRVEPIFDLLQSLDIIID